MLEILFCLVVVISDGDTLTARCGEPGGYEQIKVRIVAIDAPENKQAFGNKSKQHLSDLCFQKQATIVVHYDDRYKRKVADVKCDGKDVSSEQVRAGMAWVYPQYAKKHKYLYNLQDEAKAAKRGLWVEKNPVEPWEFRKSRRKK